MIRKTTWIVQKNLGETCPTLDALRRACAEADRPIVEVAVVPFSEEMPAIPPVTAPFVFYGYSTLIANAYRSERWREGVFFDPDAFRPESYRQHYGDLYLNADMQTATFAELDAMEWAPETRLFLRPNDDWKRWSGQVMTFAEFREWFAGFLKVEKAGRCPLIAFRPVSGDGCAPDQFRVGKTPCKATVKLRTR